VNAPSNTSPRNNAPTAPCLHEPRAPRPTRRTRARPFVRAATTLAAVAAILTGIAACGTNHAAPAVATAPPQSGVTTIPLAQRHTAPLVSGITLQGTPLALRSYVGQVIVLNVWGSWCTECRSEQSALESTYRAYQTRDVQFVGIDTRDVPAAARAYQRTFAVTYPSLQDPDESLLLPFASVLPPDAVPSTAIIDRHGRIAARILGAATQHELQQQIDSVLAGP
jgi:peroxiredoxin